jgi:hypothetical protein
VSDDNTTAAKSDPILDGPEGAAEADIIDLGDLFSKRIEKNRKEAKVKCTVELVPGLKLRVLESPAVVAQLRLNDSENDDGAFLNALLKVVHADDRPRFREFLNQDGIDADMLVEIYKTLVTAGADGRPTKRSPNSRATSTRKPRTKS